MDSLACCHFNGFLITNLSSVSSNNFHKAIDQAKLIYRADKNDDIKTFYLVIQLRNGEVLLAVGYDNQDFRHIRWMFRLDKINDFHHETFAGNLNTVHM